MLQSQAAVAKGPQFIVAQEVGPNAADNGVLLEAVDQVRRNPRRHGVAGMYTYTLTLIAQKGGTGTTTLATNLSVAAVMTGAAPEAQVERVVVRIDSQSQPPHRAEATDELVDADGRGGSRTTHWTA